MEHFRQFSVPVAIVILSVYAKHHIHSLRDLASYTLCLQITGSIKDSLSIFRGLVQTEYGAYQIEQFQRKDRSATFDI